MPPEVAVDRPQAQTVVTGENLQAFQLERMGLKADTAEVVIEKPAVAAEKQAESDEKSTFTDENEQKLPESDDIPDEGTTKGKQVVYRGKWVDKTDFGYRMHLKTQAANDARAEAAREKARADAAEERLKAKEAPPQTDGKPDPAKYQDAFKYAEDLAEWKVNQELNARDKKAAEEKQREAAEKRIETWNTRLKEAKAVLTDYDEVVGDANMTVSNECRDEILSSPQGPYIVHYLAENPDFVAKLNEMNERDMIRTIGRLEARFDKDQTKEYKGAKAEVKEAEISAALPPIKPIKAAKAPQELIDSDGEFRGTIAEWKAARKAGKIK